MRNKQMGINIRVDEKEKELLMKKARKWKLSLSAYLRNCGLNQKLIEMPNDNFIELYYDIRDIKFNINELSKDEINKKLESIEKRFREIYSGGNLYGNY